MLSSWFDFQARDVETSSQCWYYSYTLEIGLKTVGWIFINFKKYIEKLIGF